MASSSLLFVRGATGLHSSLRRKTTRTATVAIATSTSIHAATHIHDVSQQQERRHGLPSSSSSSSTTMIQRRLLAGWCHSPSRHSLRRQAPASTTFRKRQLSNTTTCSPSSESTTDSKSISSKQHEHQRRKQVPKVDPRTHQSFSAKEHIDNDQMHVDNSHDNDDDDDDDDVVRWNNWLNHWWDQLRTIPNAITLTRIASTPVLAYWIVTDQPTLAVLGCSMAAFSDFLDGWIAKRYNMATVLGTYMDPLADKILINTLSVAVWWNGTLPTPIMAIWMAKDVVLTVATYRMVHNLESYPAMTRKYNDNGTDSSASPYTPSAMGGVTATNNNQPRIQQPIDQETKKRQSRASARMAFLEKMDPLTIPLKVEPTLTSKINTGLQFVVLGMSIVHPLHNMDPGLAWAGWTTAGTTILSLLSYIGYSGLKEVGAPNSELGHPTADADNKDTDAVQSSSSLKIKMRRVPIPRSPIVLNQPRPHEQKQQK